MFYTLMTLSLPPSKRLDPSLLLLLAGLFIAALVLLLLMEYFVIRRK